MSNTQQSSTEVLLQQAIQLDQAGQHDIAASLYHQVLEQQPDHAYALHLLGANALRRGEIDTAVKLISSAIQFNPNEPSFHLFLGHINGIRYAAMFKRICFGIQNSVGGAGVAVSRPVSSGSWRQPALSVTGITT